MTGLSPKHLLSPSPESEAWCLSVIWERAAIKHTYEGHANVWVSHLQRIISHDTYS